MPFLTQTDQFTKRTRIRWLSTIVITFIVCVTLIYLQAMNSTGPVKIEMTPDNPSLVIPSPPPSITTNPPPNWNIIPPGSGWTTNNYTNGYYL